MFESDYYPTIRLAAGALAALSVFGFSALSVAQAAELTTNTATGDPKAADVPKGAGDTKIAGDAAKTTATEQKAALDLAKEIVRCAVDQSEMAVKNYNILVQSCVEDDTQYRTFYRTAGIDEQAAQAARLSYRDDDARRNAEQAAGATTSALRWLTHLVADAKTATAARKTLDENPVFRFAFVEAHDTLHGDLPQLAAAACATGEIDPGIGSVALLPENEWEEILEPALSVKVRPVAESYLDGRVSYYNSLIQKKDAADDVFMVASEDSGDDLALAFKWLYYAKAHNNDPAAIELSLSFKQKAGDELQEEDESRDTSDVSESLARSTIADIEGRFPLLFKELYSASSRSRSRDVPQYERLTPISPATALEEAKERAAAESTSTVPMSQTGSQAARPGRGRRGRRVFPGGG